MALVPRPYLIIPRLIPQPTWGGEYIATYKNWNSRFDLDTLKIGQSYELCGKSLLALDIIDSASPQFAPEIDGQEAHNAGETQILSDLVKQDPTWMLGKSLVTQFEPNMTLLVKFTQAKGNSFQLHKRADNPDPKWKPKPESWYFFEPGHLTYGLTKGCDVAGYKASCVRINEYMKNVSSKVVDKILPLDEAKKQANTFIHEENPWQYVNVHHVDTGSLIDLSIGALHHSWEEDNASEMGNIVYEVQVDVTDAESTLRSFDQGKFKADGTIRDLTIDEYFSFIDRDPIHNDLQFAKRKRQGETLLSTPFYALDEYTLDSQRAFETGNSFAHLFVRSGMAEVICTGGMVRLTQGHSCFIPNGAKTFIIKPVNSKAIILKTYIA